MTVLGIDPGSEQSAWVLWDGQRVVEHRIDSNTLLRQWLPGSAYARQMQVVVIEQIASYGMAVGAEVFETCVWTGRFMEAARGVTVERMPRRDVKLHLCGQARAKDANVRQALIDRFGGKDTAIGKKASKGPLYGLTGDCWQALALAVTWHDLHAVAAPEARR